MGTGEGEREGGKGRGLRLRAAPGPPFGVERNQCPCAPSAPCGGGSRLSRGLPSSRPPPRWRGRTGCLCPPSPGRDGGWRGSGGAGAPVPTGSELRGCCGDRSRAQPVVVLQPPAKENGTEMAVWGALAGITSPSQSSGTCNSIPSPLCWCSLPGTALAFLISLSRNQPNGSNRRSLFSCTELLIVTLEARQRPSFCEVKVWLGPPESHLKGSGFTLNGT